MKEREKIKQIYKKMGIEVEEIKRDFKIQTIITVIVAILAIIVCFKAMKLAIDYEALEKEKKALEEYIKIKNIKYTPLAQ